MPPPAHLSEDQIINRGLRPPPSPLRKDYTMRKQLICKSTPKGWKVIIRVTDAKFEGSNCDTTIASFAKRPMGLITMAAAVTALQKSFFLDEISIIANKARLDELISVGIVDREVLA